MGVNNTQRVCYKQKLESFFLIACNSTTNRRRVVGCLKVQQMKANDFFRGDKCVPITPNDTIDNVCLNQARWSATPTYQAGQIVAADFSTYSAWVTSTPYLVGSIVTNAGALWRSNTAHTDAVAPVQGPIWSQITAPLYWKAIIANTNVVPTEDGVNWTAAGTNFDTLPSAIFCAGASGTIQVICADGTQIAFPAPAIAAGGFLLLGNLRVKRVMATGTAATLLYAVAE
jgi:hypothetical protein